MDSLHRLSTSDASATVKEEQPVRTHRHQECALCLEKFKSPRILPCFHTFCLQCLTGVVDNQQGTDSFPCPTCRTKIDIPPGGVSKFQVNFYIEAEVDAESLMSQPLACATGCTMAATHKCFECDQLMCDYCKRVHGTIPVTKSHTVLSLNSSTLNLT
ncbi:E3 ubiquitin-protein ligase TRIM56-like isoform X2 [Pomacea canaliculata]|uniref:E3 ubiquitin-protein ligase TRIM56-like isoform X2 n=1 Tax=Pomacea canaliculata TaxID=400727 RepID=UPI000D73DF1F|nr:E3 ubiquitin-protein ligase TRIM56-like isoform X2 [Pomacea canaliculata]